MVKNCNKCKVELSDENWYVSFKKLGALKCKACHALAKSGYGLHSKTAWASRLKRNSKDSSKKKGLSSSMDKRKILSMFDDQNGKCYWTNIPMRISNKPKDLFQPSIDRLDCSKGYIDGNCVLSTMAANYARNDSTPEEFQEWINAIKSVK